MATSWINSRSPRAGPRIGAATTTSPKSLFRAACAGKPSLFPHGLWSVREPAAPARRSAATIRYRPELNATRLCVVDPEGSAFFSLLRSRRSKRLRRMRRNHRRDRGAPRVEPSFIRNVVDQMIAVARLRPSIAGARWLEGRMGRRLWAPRPAPTLPAPSHSRRKCNRLVKHGSIATLACRCGAIDMRTRFTMIPGLRLEKIDLRAWQQRFPPIGRPRQLWPRSAARPAAMAYFQARPNTFETIAPTGLAADFA